MNFKLRLSLHILLFVTQVSFASNGSIVWKGIYHQGVPNRSDVSHQYCKEHTPGIFIHSVNDVLAHGIKTNKGIKLDHATFNEEKKHGVYFITGDLMAHGKAGSVNWNDHIHYYLYKLTENGLTQGVWRTKECKGFYTGVVVESRK